MLGNLNGLNVLLTRQNENNLQLMHRIEALSGHAMSLPLLAIDSLLTPALISAINKNLAHSNLCICVSRNAAVLCLPHVQNPDKFTWATIGPSTAQYLFAQGCAKVIYPQQSPYDSAALLHALEMHNIKLTKQYIMILTGSGGDDWLQKTLSKRGAMVELIPIYNRVMPEAAHDQFINIFKNIAAIDIILITCVTSLANLIYLARVAQIMIYKLPLLVVSQRIYEYAIAQGFESVYVAQSMTDESILIALENYRCLNAKKH